VRIEQTHSGFFAYLANKQGEQSISTNKIIFACDSQTISKLIAPLDASLENSLLAIPHAKLGLLHLAFPKDTVKHPLDGFGFLSPPEVLNPLLGAMFSSSSFSDRAPSGMHLITCFCGGGYYPEFADVTRKEVQNAVIEQLSRLIGASSPPNILHAVSWPKAIPMYPLFHHQLLEQITAFEAAHPNLTLLGNWREGISISDRLQDAFKCAEKML
jgi:oxygen-dependent protoporphyrinogen oxidase